MLWRRGALAVHLTLLAGLGLAAFLAVMVAPSEAGQRPRPADLVLHNGDIWANDGREGSTAVAVKGGRIVAVGSDKRVLRRAGRGTLIDRMAAKGVIGSMQLSFATSDQHFAESAVGPIRAQTSYAWKTMLRRGVRLAGGSDFSVEVLAPLWGLQRVVTRTEFDGTPPGGW